MLLFVALNFYALPAQNTIIIRYDTATRTEFLYDSGQLIQTARYENFVSPKKHVTWYYRSGAKSFEYSMQDNFYCDTTREWTEDGILYHIEIYSDSGYIDIHFWNNGQILSHDEYRIAGPHKPVSIKDSTGRELYYSTRCDTHCYAPSGACCTFHENGKVESEGEYLPYQFTGIAEVPCACGDTWDSSFVSCWVAVSTNVPDGKWIYYNSQGEKIREEYYEGGLLKSVVEVH